MIYSNGAVNKNIPMVPNPLTAKDGDKKPDKLLESETFQQTADGAYMMSDIGSKLCSSTFSQQLDPTDTYDKSESLNPVDTYDKSSPLIKVS